MGRAADAALEEAAATAGTDSEDEGEGEEEEEDGEGDDDGRQDGEHGGAAAQAAASRRLWPPASLDLLLFVARSDPSVRVRREALRLLGWSVAAVPGSPQVGAGRSLDSAAPSSGGAMPPAATHVRAR